MGYTTTQIVYIVESDKYDRPPKIRFETFYLERTGINSFKVKESIISTSTAFTFEEAKDIAKKYDVYKNNPFPDKIFNHPDINLTPEELKAYQEALNKNDNPDPANETTEENVKRRVDNDIPQDARETFRNLFIVDENGNFREGPDDWEAMKKWLDGNYPE
jgi:hypothetical protein